MLIKQSLEFIRCDNKFSCDCSRRNGILGSSLEENIFLSTKNLTVNLIKSEFHLQFCCNWRDCITFLKWYIVVSLPVSILRKSVTVCASGGPMDEVAFVCLISKTQ